MYLEINNLRMFVAERSASDEGTILFLHGFPFDHSMWRHQLAYFGTEYHCLAPDLRGHGGTLEIGEPLPADQVTMDLFADDLIQMMDKLLPQERKVTLCGLSMGGYIAFALWRKAAHRIERMILADTKATADDAAAREKRAAQAEKVRANGTRAIADGMLEALLAPANRDMPVAAEVRRMIESSPAQGVINSLHALAQRPDSTPTLATIKVPTHVIVGEHDQLTPLKDAQAMSHRLHGVKVLDVVPFAGHLSPLENPDAFNQSMLHFMRGD